MTQPMVEAGRKTGTSKPPTAGFRLKDLLAKVKAYKDEAPVTRLGLLVLAHTALTATTTDATSTLRHDNRVNFFDLSK
jgi:hypothetical protein